MAGLRWLIGWQLHQGQSVGRTAEGLSHKIPKVETGLAQCLNNASVVRRLGRHGFECRILSITQNFSGKPSHPTTPGSHGLVNEAWRNKCKDLFSHHAWAIGSWHSTSSGEHNQVRFKTKTKMWPQFILQSKFGGLRVGNDSFLNQTVSSEPSFN